MVNAPTRPINILNIMITFPESVNELVIPVERPTVENDETTSNKRDINPNCGWHRIADSVIQSRSNEMRIPVIKNKSTENARRISSFGIVLLNRETFLSSRIVETIAAKIKANVEVLIPPPVEPDDAPINIRKINTRRAGILINDKSSVLNPAVRELTD